MSRYFRVQPAGLDIAGHYSQDSGDGIEGLHVFDEPGQVFATDVPMSVYGDEIVVVEAPDSWENGDVEGVCIDPSTAIIVARYAPAAFLAHYWPDLDDGEDPDGFNVRGDWQAA